ncbi:MAG: glucose-1-phosphate cytidylyltransferase [Candidatus Wallbacteria bacterium HGW-Wallbacteria-1]|jgi:glucose-1-phosphate cytidylyltransferase|uniref:Glucose-1-phosphate cytidylyltransferase n=1 Tax=Candidatus Wallbacteria bacterium HGW-Wallbacteria-1 TaxID=2013854 RepID=A0A2N1PN09_9BACT|nr:MAG: glucose-1-phosphate cytidylyltransferase [Candidatus Wallbacteria bacterium HGW-Wallbacteria-1]
MKAVFLAGGMGTRITEESVHRPKPMVEIGGYPIIWHIMKHYSVHGINEFIICCGYKGYVIKEYFANYFLHMSDVTFDMRNNTMKVHHRHAEPWQVTVIDTGLETMTGGRIKRIKSYLEDESFCMTYGDGVSNVDITALIEHHRNQGKMATVTAVQLPNRFGAITTDGSDLVCQFNEKSIDEGGWINGGFFVLEPGIFDFIENDATIWERDPLQGLASQEQLCAFRHRGFWKCMDHLRDKIVLEEMWARGEAPWCTWE